MRLRVGCDEIKSSIKVMDKIMMPGKQLSDVEAAHIN